MDADPIAVALKFGFLAVLYGFLFWVARSALRDVRGRAAAGERAAERGVAGRAAEADATLVVLRGGELDPGARLDVFGGVTIGRSPEADVRIEDRYASGIHARVHVRDGDHYVEDMASTNGTYLNGERLDGEDAIRDLDEIRIGDTEFRFELDVRGDR
jgi:hypothetical protein